MTMEQTMETTRVPTRINVGRFWKARVFSFAALASMLGGCGALAREGYYVATDSFVAPAILSPNNDLVLDARMKLESILLQKAVAEQALAEAEVDLEAGEKATVKLIELRDTVGHALTWTSNLTGAQVSMGSADVKVIATQKDELHAMIARQQQLVDDAKANMSGGLIPRPDYDREVQALDALKLALFENDRTRMASDLQLKQASMGQQALSAGKGTKMPMPDQVMALNSLITIEVQLLQTEAMQRTKIAEKEKDQEELKKIEVLERDLRARPIFKAIDSNLSIAFVPYTQLKGVNEGAKVMDCMWGIFNCHEVGTVKGIVAGESIFTDPFDTQARGQFITLVGVNEESMRAKVLRVRSVTNKFELHFLIAGR